MDTPLGFSSVICLLHRQKLDLVQQVARRIEAVSGVLAEGEGGENPEAFFSPATSYCSPLAPKRTKNFNAVTL
jgi:hypothetical protein